MAATLLSGATSAPLEMEMQLFFRNELKGGSQEERRTSMEAFEEAAATFPAAAEQTLRAERRDASFYGPGLIKEEFMGCVRAITW